MSIQEQQEAVKAEAMTALGQGFFMANGVKYNIIAAERLSGDRYRAYRKGEIEIANGLTLIGVGTGLNDASTLMQNATNFGANHKALEILLNLQKGIQNFTEQPHDEIQRFCSIFCVTAIEDLKTYDTSLMPEKINDWDEEGIPNGFFHVLAANIMRGLIELYSLTSRLSQVIQSAGMEIVGEGTDARLIIKDL